MNEMKRSDGAWCFDVAMFIVTWICFLGLGHFGLFGASDVTKIPPFCELTFSTFSAGSSHHDPSLSCFLNCEIFWTSLTKGSSLSFWLQTAADSFFLLSSITLNPKISLWKITITLLLHFFVPNCSPMNLINATCAAFRGRFQWIFPTGIGKSRTDKENTQVAPRATSLHCRALF